MPGKNRSIAPSPGATGRGFERLAIRRPARALDDARDTVDDRSKDRSKQPSRADERRVTSRRDLREWLAGLRHKEPDTDQRRQWAVRNIFPMVHDWVDRRHQ